MSPPQKKAKVKISKNYLRVNFSLLFVLEGPLLWKKTFSFKSSRFLYWFFLLMARQSSDRACGCNDLVMDTAGYGFGRIWVGFLPPKG